MSPLYRLLFFSKIEKENRKVYQGKKNMIKMFPLRGVPWDIPLL